MRISYKISELIKLFSSEQDVMLTTMKLYTANIRRFFIWADRNRLDKRNLQRADVIQYKNEMIRDHEVTTAESYLVPVKKFYSWLSDKGWSSNISAGIKTPRRNRDYKKKGLQPDQVKELLASFDHNSVKSKRDFAMVSLMLRNGLRCSEVVRLSVGDVIEKSEQMGVMVQGKGQNDKIFLPITDKVAVPLEQYLLTRKLNDKDALFTSIAYNNMNGRMTPNSVSTMVKSKLKLIGIDDKDITAHSLRHTTAQMLLRADVSLYEVQKFMRHSDPKITEIYLNSMNEEIMFKNTSGKKLDELF